MKTYTEPTRKEFHETRKIAQAAVNAAFAAFKGSAATKSDATVTTRLDDPKNKATVQLVRVGKGTKKHVTDGVRAVCGADVHGWNYSELRQAGMTTPNRISADVTCDRCKSMFGAS